MAYAPRSYSIDLHAPVSARALLLWAVRHVAPLRYRTHTVGCWWRKAFECEGRMAAAEKPKMNTYQTVSVWAIAPRSDRVGAPSALFLPRWETMTRLMLATLLTAFAIGSA